MDVTRQREKGVRACVRVCVCVSVRVRVCVCERERERERDGCYETQGDRRSWRLEFRSEMRSHYTGKVAGRQCRMMGRPWLVISMPCFRGRQVGPSPSRRGARAAVIPFASLPILSLSSRRGACSPFSIGTRGK